VEPPVAAFLTELSAAARLLLIELAAEAPGKPVVRELRLDWASERMEERSPARELAMLVRGREVISPRRELAIELAPPRMEVASPRREERSPSEGSWAWTAQAPIAATMIEVKRMVTVVIWLKV
jgi:hypothetical protein